MSWVLGDYRDELRSAQPLSGSGAASRYRWTIRRRFLFGLVGISPAVACTLGSWQLPRSPERTFEQYRAVGSNSFNTSAAYEFRTKSAKYSALEKNGKRDRL